MYGLGTYQFFNYGFVMKQNIIGDTVHLRVLFDDPLYDSENNRHEYKAIITNETLKPFKKTIKQFIDLLEETYNETPGLVFEFTEKKNPDRMIIEIYECDTYDTLVSVELHTV